LEAPLGVIATLVLATGIFLPEAVGTHGIHALVAIENTADLTGATTPLFLAVGLLLVENLNPEVEVVIRLLVLLAKRADVGVVVELLEMVLCVKDVGFQGAVRKSLHPRPDRAAVAAHAPLTLSALR